MCRHSNLLELLLAISLGGLAMKTVLKYVAQDNSKMIQYNFLFENPIRVPRFIFQIRAVSVYLIGMIVIICRLSPMLIDEFVYADAVRDVITQTPSAAAHVAPLGTCFFHQGGHQLHALSTAPSLGIRGWRVVWLLVPIC